MISAKYTKLYKDWVNEPVDPLIPNYSVTMYITNMFKQSPFNSDMGSDLYSMVMSVFAFYEIGDEDTPTMIMFFQNTFDEYKDYYYELITNYKKKYDYELNNKRVITKVDVFNMEGNTKVTNKTDGSNVEYTLPNKVVENSNWRSTPSGINDNNQDTENNKDYINETTRESTHTTEFNNELIDLKNKYINQIRNVYREFAMKFKDCFYQIY